MYSFPSVHSSRKGLVDMGLTPSSSTVFEMTCKFPAISCRVCRYICSAVAETLAAFFPPLHSGCPKVDVQIKRGLAKAWLNVARFVMRFVEIREKYGEKSFGGGDPGWETASFVYLLDSDLSIQNIPQEFGPFVGNLA